MSIFTKIYQQAKAEPKRIVLPEGEDERVIIAAAIARQQKFAEVILLGNVDIIMQKAKRNKIKLSLTEVIHPQTDRKLDEYVHAYWNLRQHKGITPEKARELVINDSVYFGAMMLRQAQVDGLVAGAVRTTSDVARAILRCIEKDLQYQTSSGSFFIEIKDKDYGENGLFLFADCAIVPLPSVEQLVDITLSSTQVWVKVTGYPPRVAMLSFSSRGSSAHELLDKVRKATAMVKIAKPELVIDGELQADSAIEPAVAKIKVPQSPLQGRANILIFPNLEAANIAYKLMQRLAKARVVGPIMQGLTKPCSDLSRGCAVREIVDAIAVTVVRAQ